VHGQVGHRSSCAPNQAERSGQVAQVVERSPEKAGVGGSTPSLATIFIKYFRTPQTSILSHSVTQNLRLPGVASQLTAICGAPQTTTHSGRHATRRRRQFHSSNTGASECDCMKPIVPYIDVHRCMKQRVYAYCDSKSFVIKVLSRPSDLRVSRDGAPFLALGRESQLRDCNNVTSARS
jgi:hypothetical protein